MSFSLLVTGGAGFIGSCFIEHMLQNHPDYKVINLDKLTYAANLDNLRSVEGNPNYTFVQGDIYDSALVADLMEQVDGCINFAAESHVDNSIKNPHIFIETNVMGTHNLLHWAREHKVERFLQVSTDEVYGSLGATGYFTESSPIQPSSPYSASKASADLLVEAYNKTFGLPTLITRCSNNYGPHQHIEKLIPLIITRAAKGQPLPIYGDGQNIRDWLYVYDHCAAIDEVFHQGEIGNVYNIGGNNEKTNLQIVKTILQILEKDESLITFVEDRLGHDRRYAIDPTKIRTQLGWEPKVSFEEGIRQTISDIQKSKYLNI